MAYASRGYGKALADQYYREIMKGRVAPKSKSGPATSSPTNLGSIYSGLIGNPNSAPIKPNDMTLWQKTLDNLGNPKSGVGKALDIITQPLYATVESGLKTAVNAQKAAETGDIGALLNPFDSNSVNPMTNLKR